MGVSIAFSAIIHIKNLLYNKMSAIFDTISGVCGITHCKICIQDLRSN